MCVLATTLFAPDIVLIMVLIGGAALLARALGLAAPMLVLFFGLLAGPGLGIIEAGNTAEVLADLGLVFLLFLIGTELKFDRIRPTLWTTIRVTPAQMGITFLVFFGISRLFFDVTTALVIGVATTYSSTAVVLRILEERNEVDTVAGQLDTGLLLFEDMTVVVVITAITAGAAATGLLGALMQTLLALVLIGGAAYVCARFIFPHTLARFYDEPHAYFLQAVGWLFLFLGLSELVGISHEIGAFFIGIALAQIPGNEELHERVRPLTELFMALFFVSLAVSLSATDLLVHWEVAVLFAVAVFVDKFLVHYGLFTLTGYDQETSFRGSVNMMQTSDFSIVLGATAVGAGLVGQDILGLLTLVALTTMMVSTVFIDKQDWLYSLIGTVDHGEHRETEIVVVGFGEAGPDILDVLEGYTDDIVVVDPDPATARILQGTDHTHVFADIRHEEIKRQAGFYTASLVLGVDLDPETGLDMLAARPERTVMVTEDSSTATAFREAGADTVLDREELGSHHLQHIITTVRGETDG